MATSQSYIPLSSSRDREPEVHLRNTQRIPVEPLITLHFLVGSPAFIGFNAIAQPFTGKLQELRPVTDKKTVLLYANANAHIGVVIGFLQYLVF